jgi:hypothetical protein
MTSDLQETTSLKNDMSTSDTRRDQMFPSLSPGESDRLRLGTIQRNRPGMFVLTSGTVGVTRHAKGWGMSCQSALADSES